MNYKISRYNFALLFFSSIFVAFKATNVGTFPFPSFECQTPFETWHENFFPRSLSNLCLLKVLFCFRKYIKTTLSETRVYVNRFIHENRTSPDRILYILLCESIDKGEKLAPESL
jgi:hypothetical protein